MREIRGNGIFPASLERPSYLREWHIPRILISNTNFGTENLGRHAAREYLLARCDKGGGS
jgi:hypothetical protein